uniref:Uncharacterized protein n=1 Tax=Amphimedon queenslandica TaxID=400682 RepID=A0A1X7UWV7_AMPQE
MPVLFDRDADDELSDLSVQSDNLFSLKVGYIPHDCLTNSDSDHGSDLDHDGILHPNTSHSGSSSDKGFEAPKQHCGRSDEEAYESKIIVIDADDGSDLDQNSNSHHNVSHSGSSSEGFAAAKDKFQLYH